MDIKIFGQVGGLGFDVDKIVSDINSAEEEINIHMMSVGGTAIYGLSIFDALKASKQKTNAFIYGFAYSAGSVICAGCDYVTMSDVGSLMIHEVHGASEEVNNFLTQRAIAAYNIKTGIAKEELAEMMTKDFFINADQALEMGFIDEKMDFKQAVAYADLFNIENKKEVKTMSEIDEVKAAEVAENKAVEVAEVAQPVEEAKQEVAEPKEELKAEAKTEEVEAVAQAEVAEVDEKADLKKYMQSFGDAEGAKMFVEGITFEAAQQKHITSQNDKIEELQAKLAEQSLIIEAGKKEIGGEALQLGAVEPKAQAKASFVRFADSK